VLNIRIFFISLHLLIIILIQKIESFKWFLTYSTCFSGFLFNRARWDDRIKAGRVRPMQLLEFMEKFLEKWLFLALEESFGDALTRNFKEGPSLREES